MTDAAGSLPNLFASQEQERTWSIEESQWRNSSQNRVALCECWYRRWNRVTVIRSPDGRVVEYDRKTRRMWSQWQKVWCRSIARLCRASAIVVVARAAQAGGCRSSRAARKISVCPVLGMREDRTGVPFGLARGMVYLQDEINATRSKAMWMMAARRVERTQGAVVGEDRAIQAGSRETRRGHHS